MANVHASEAFRRAPRPRREPGWIATLSLLLVEALVAIVLVIAGIGMFARVRVAWQTPVDLRAAVPLIDQQLRERPAPRQLHGPAVEPPVAQPPSIDRGGETDVDPIAPAPAAAPERAVDSEAASRPPERPASVAAEREPGADAAAPADTTGSVAPSRSAEDRTGSADPPAATATTVETAAAAAAIAPAAAEPADAAAAAAPAARIGPPPPVEAGRDASVSTTEPPKPEAVAPAERRIVSEVGRPDTSPPVPPPSAEAPSAGATDTQRAEAVTATATAESGSPVAAETRSAERPVSQAEKPETTGSIDRVPVAATNAGDAAAEKRDPSTAGAAAAIGPARPRTAARSKPHHRAVRHARLHRAPAPPAQPATTQTTYGFYPFKSF